MSAASRFTSRDDAVAEVVRAIEASGVVADAWAEYDVPAICDAVIGTYATGYAQTVTTDEFWACVQRHVLFVADPGRKTVEQMIAHAWDVAERAQNGGVPRPLIEALTTAIWRVEDHLDHGNGDRAACVIALAQASVVVGRCMG
ncbi:hypothetical protein [Gordonia sp. NPDC003429]